MAFGTIWLEMQSPSLYDRTEAEATDLNLALWPLGGSVHQRRGHWGVEHKLEHAAASQRLHDCTISACPVTPGREGRGESTYGGCEKCATPKMW